MRCERLVEIDEMVFPQTRNNNVCIKTIICKIARFFFARIDDGLANKRRGLATNRHYIWIVRTDYEFCILRVQCVNISAMTWQLELTLLNRVVRP